MIVVDTSVLVDFLRGRSTPAARTLRRLEEEAIPFAIPAVCCQELLSGARDTKEWQLLLAYLETQSILLPGSPWHTHVEAARIMFDCRRQGIILPGAVDCFIAQCVLETSGILLHDDADFERIKSARPLQTLGS